MQSSSENPSEFISKFASKLGVALQASPREIREAYIKLKRVYSGGTAAYSMISDEQRLEQLQELEVAYSGLTDWAQVNQDQGGIQALGLNSDLKKPKSFEGVRVNLEATDKVRSAMTKAEEKESFGSGKTLSSVRVAHGLSVEDVHRSLKIGKEFILALEAEDFPSLPAAIYVKGFMKNLLRHLSFERVDQFVDQYLKKYKKWQQTQKTSVKAS